MEQYKTHAYEDQVGKYIKDNNIAFTDVSEEVIAEVLEKPFGLSSEICLKLPPSSTYPQIIISRFRN